MQIAARNAFTAGGGGWTNPYVTDGLIAMWDGEWNAGGGVHDATATTWVDLISGIAQPIPSSLAFDGNGLSVISIEPAWGNQFTVVPEAQFEEITFEMVLSNIQKTFLDSQYDQIWWSRVSAFKFNFGYASRPDVWSGQTVPYSFAVRFLWSRMGAGFAQLNLNEPTYPDRYASGEMRGDVVIPQVSDPGHIGNTYHCIRRYSRMLTDAEIAANYAIDKQRFNLP